MYCEKCGKEIKNDAKFCRYCGALVQPQEDKSEIKTDTKKKSEAEEFEEKRKIFCIALVIVFAVIIAVVLGVKYFNMDEKKIIGDWVAVSGFSTAHGFPDSMIVYDEGVSIEGYDGTYRMDKDNKMLNLNVSVRNASFHYELEDNLLYLKDTSEENAEVGIYLNLDKASKEEAAEYYFGKSVAEDDRLKDYLVGKWNCTERVKGDEDIINNYTSSTDYYIEFTEEEDDKHVKYNLPVPDRGEDDNTYEIRTDNKMTVGSKDLNAFQFIPKSESEMAVYCYEDDGYYNFEREY